MMCTNGMHAGPKQDGYVRHSCVCEHACNDPSQCAIPSAHKEGGGRKRDLPPPGKVSESRVAAPEQGTGNSL